MRSVYLIASLVFLCETFAAFKVRRSSTTDHQHRFIEQPSDGYVIQQGSTIIYCKSQNAADAWFQCNSRQSFKERQNAHLITDGIPTIELHLEITRKDLDSFASQSTESGASESVFKCWCVSKSVQGNQIESRKASIRLAFIETSFQVEPSVTMGILSNHGQLDCIPPNGFPKPRIHWFKDKIPYPCPTIDFVDDPTDEKCILLTNGTLVINNLTQTDQGEYMCQAGNAAGTRLSQEVKLTIVQKDDNKSTESSTTQLHSSLLVVVVSSIVTTLFKSYH